jgi:hypothetical protein
METTVKAEKTDEELIIYMDRNIEDLRKVIWKTIFAFRKENSISECDVAMALGIIQYELIHHTKG